MPTPNTVSGSWRSRNSRKTPPDTGARAVFVQRFHAHVPPRECLRQETISDRKVSDAGSPCNTLFSPAFLVIEHELDGDTRAAASADAAACAVAREVARVARLRRCVFRHGDALRGAAANAARRRDHTICEAHAMGSNHRH